MYSEKEVLRLVEDHIHRKGWWRRFDIDYVRHAVYSVCDRKRHRPLTAEDAAAVAIETLLTTQRRLSHGTGATNWRE